MALCGVGTGCVHEPRADIAMKIHVKRLGDVGTRVIEAATKANHRQHNWKRVVCRINIECDNHSRSGVDYRVDGRQIISGFNVVLTRIWTRNGVHTSVIVAAHSVASVFWILECPHGVCVALR